MKIIRCLLLSGLLFFAASPAVWAGLIPVQLRCEYATDPLGVDVAAPRLFWQVTSKQRGQRQTAYQILAASTAELLRREQGDLWDSGKVVSDETIQICYGGKGLNTAQEVFWKVRAWDAARKVSVWSKPAKWTMGVLSRAEWKASWISAPPIPAKFAGCSWIWFPEGNPATAAPPEKRYFRKTFVPPDQSLVTNAVLVMTADNGFTAWLNGIEIGKGDDYTLAYSFVVHSALRAGTNCLTIAASNTGQTPNPAGMIGKLILQHADGSQTVIQMDAMWRAAKNPEVGWQSPDFDDQAWANALVLGAYGITPWEGGATVPTPAPLFRREFTVRPGLKRALVFICGLGQYAMTLNGEKVGDDVLSPGWTKYDRTCLYDTRDITAELRRGKNAVGIELGDGMYHLPASRFQPPAFRPYSFGPLQAIAQVRLEYTDGSVDYVGTDENWRCASGPTVSASIYSGEDYDARRAQPDWNKFHFDDAKWNTAVVAPGPGGELKGLSCAAPPIRLFEIHQPVSVRPITNGDMLYDLGQNAAHIPKISVTGPAGSRVRIIPSELGDGKVSFGSMSEKPRSVIWCDFTKATDGVETWSPKFFYIGCRYLEVKCFPAAGQTNLPVVKSIAGIVVHSASEPVGEFECSSPLFNRIRQLVRWAQRSNMMSLMTDCPQREKRGWLEEDHLNGPALRCEYDLNQLFTKTLNDIADSQLTNGLVPTTAPEYALFGAKKSTDPRRDNFGDSPEWGSAFILVPWQQYEFAGDLDLFRRHYAAMKNYTAYLATRANNYIVSYGLGDWFDIGPKPPGVAQLTPIELTATAVYFQDVQIMAQVAALLGRTKDAKNFHELAEQIRAAFNRKFYNPATHSYATGSQCANSIPLVMGLCEPTNRAAVLAAIVADVRQRGNALTAGDVGYRYLLRALADGGRSDVVFDINNQSEKPGYGMQLKKGATALTEAWDAAPGPSQNHFMLGQIMEWFYHDLGGIGCDPAGPGFKKIIINPQPVGDVTWAKTSCNSIQGRIICQWTHADGNFTLAVTIPANTTATVFVPAKSANEVTEGGQRAAKSSGVKFLREQDGRAIYEVGGGSYEFHSRLCR